MDAAWYVVGIAVAVVFYGGICAYPKKGQMASCVVRWVDRRGAIEASYAYDAFGNIIQKGGVKADELKICFSDKYSRKFWMQLNRQLWYNVT